MEVRGIVERKKFLGFMCKPSKGILCKTLTLKAGVLIGSLVDIALGFVNFFDLAMLFRDHRRSMTSLEMTGVTVGGLVCITTIPFAFIGFAGILNTNAEQLRVYSVYKRLEAVFFCIFTLLFHLLVICPVYDCDIMLATLITIVRSWYNFYIAYIVWSADVRLQHNEGILVNHGETVVQLMDQQTSALVPSVQLSESNAMHLYPTGTPVA